MVAALHLQGFLKHFRVSSGPAGKREKTRQWARRAGKASACCKRNMRMAKIKNVAIQMDHVSGINIAGDSTFAMSLEASELATA